jgi:hypothetical protein
VVVLFTAWQSLCAEFQAWEREAQADFCNSVGVTDQDSLQEEETTIWLTSILRRKEVSAVSVLSKDYKGYYREEASYKGDKPLAHWI